MFEENVKKFNKIMLYAGTNTFDQSCVINQLILNLSYFQGKNVPLNVLFNKQIQCKKVIHIGDKHTIVIKDNAFFEEGIIFSFPTSSFEIDSNKSFLLVDGDSIGDSNSSRFGSIIIKGIHTIISNSIYLDKILIYQAKKVVFNSTVYTNTLDPTLTVGGLEGYYL